MIRNVILYTETWAIVSLVVLISICLAILVNALIDLRKNRHTDTELQRKFFVRSVNLISLTIHVGPLIGMLSTNNLGASAMHEASNVLSVGADSTAKMGEMFLQISGAMYATTLGIITALVGYVVDIVCRQIYTPTEPLTAETYEAEECDEEVIVMKKRG